MTINERIFQLLDEKGLSNADLAKGADIKANTISDWKTKGTNPSAEKIFRISEFLGVTSKYLLTGMDSEISVHDQRIVSAYHAASEGTRRAVDKLLDIP